jgi:hypothetical protein
VVQNGKIENKGKVAVAGGSICIRILEQKENSLIFHDT